MTQKTIRTNRSHSMILKGLAPVVALALGSLAQPSWAQQDPAGDPVVKKSSGGICHDASSRHFSRVKSFKAYSSMQACLDDGGRKPKR